MSFGKLHLIEHNVWIAMRTHIRTFSTIFSNRFVHISLDKQFTFFIKSSDTFVTTKYNFFSMIFYGILHCSRLRLHFWIIEIHALHLISDIVNNNFFYLKLLTRPLLLFVVFSSLSLTQPVPFHFIDYLWWTQSKNHFDFVFDFKSDKFVQTTSLYPLCHMPYACPQPRDK